MVWKSATYRDDKGWYAEFEIPYSALRFPKREVQDWSVNIVRHIRRYRASYAWNPIDITNENISSQAGTIKGFKYIDLLYDCHFCLTYLLMLQTLMEKQSLALMGVWTLSMVSTKVLP